ncbi:MAG: hypothetical protein J6S53_00280 [Lentisphaeria bacterium]|nr:hypothetical protein [Lentisphaeria bacterium]
MIPDDKIYEKIRILHHFRQEGNLLEITPSVVLDAPESTTLIASFFVDSFEMIESARFSVEKGANTLAFRQKVKIINPLIWNPHTLGEPALYELKTVFYKNGAAHFLIIQMAGLRQAQIVKNGENISLYINGKELLCHYHDFSETASVAEIMRLSRKYGFNFTIVKGSDLCCAEKILEVCDRTGIAVALDISGMDRRMGEELSLHPSICLHTAPEGEFSFVMPDFPFLTLDKVKNLLVRKIFTGENGGEE